MKRVSPVLCVLLAAPWGCGPKVTLRGLLIEGPQGQRRNLFTDVRVNDEPVTVRLKTFQTIRSPHPLVIRVRQPCRSDFTALTGPGAVGRVENAAATYCITKGWVYLTDKDPCGCTDWVSACAEGTGAAVEIFDDEVHRVHFYHGAKLSVKAIDTGETTTMFEPGKFIEVDSSGSISGPMDIGSDDDAKKLKAEITEWAEAAGVPPP